MEYGEMMRQFARFCAAQEEIAEQAGMEFQCEGCPLEKNSVCDNLPCAVKPEDVADVERVVTRWAEEHPEPVYPTFREWLISIGVIGQMSTHSVIADKLAMTPIPADIAENLGIEPKEG